MAKLTPTKDGTCLPDMANYNSNLQNAVYYKLSIGASKVTGAFHSVVIWVRMTLLVK